MVLHKQFSILTHSPGQKPTLSSARSPVLVAATPAWGAACPAGGRSLSGCPGLPLSSGTVSA